MAKPRLLDAYTRESDTITAINSDYAIVLEWTDQNPRGEDRIGYFVSNDSSTEGVTIITADSTSKVLGVTVSSPGFASNVDRDTCETYDLLPGFSYVSFAGFAPVIDNGTCSVNGVCTVSTDGTAIPSTTGCGYRVVARVDENRVMIHLDPLLQMEVKGNRLVISY